LLERVATLDAITSMRPAYAVRTERGDVMGERPADDVFPMSVEPQRWRYARSNGVALHRDWSRACQRAVWEVAERDRIVRSWLGELRPERVPFPREEWPTIASYDWRAYRFAEVIPGHFSSAVHVVGVFGFPLGEECPLVLGFAGRSREADAMEAARGEALQLLAFLWGEPLPEPERLSEEPTAGMHLDTYQLPGAHAAIRRWLEGDHSRFAERGDRKRRVVERQQVAFVDLTPAWLPAGLRVAKALCDDAIPLTFGKSPWVAHLPSELRLHPIP
jgi:hypothetical protein